MDVLTTQRMKQVDDETIARFYPGIELMERAGRRLAEFVVEHFPADGFKAVIFVGPGNNGGDALVMARYLSELDRACTLHYLSSPEKFTIDTAKNYQRLRERVEHKRHLREIDSTRSDWGVAAKKDLDSATLVVDGIFGTGLSRDLDGTIAKTVDMINACGAPVLAIDTPSGIDGDTGAVLGTAVDADVTVTMGFPKLGMLFYPGKSHVGELVVADLGFPEEVLQSNSEGMYLLDRDEAAKRLPPRAPDAHKYQNGTAVLVAGSRAYTGAALLAAEAALRSGCGMVYAVVPESIRPVIQSGLREAIVVAAPETAEGSIARGALEVIAPYLDKAGVVMVGPGLGAQAETMEFARELVTGSTLPVVLDADGITAFAGAAQQLEGIAAPLVLTPHSGELERLLGESVPSQPLERIAKTRDVARALGVTLAHKGAPTLIGTPDGHIWINHHGNSALATAGTGDVLTGLIGGFVAQGAGGLDAAALGCFLHGRAGELAGDATGERGVIAGDLMYFLGEAMGELETIAGTAE